jgi:hypothetical protein
MVQHPKGAQRSTRSLSSRGLMGREVREHLGFLTPCMTPRCDSPEHRRGDCNEQHPTCAANYAGEPQRFDEMNGFALHSLAILTLATVAALAYGR